MNTGSYQKSLVSINKDIDRFMDLIQIINSPESVAGQLKTLREKSSDGTFKVLVIGKFSSGKSTMINALLGESILPERATTATAIITEIRYGKEKKAVAYPKKGKWPGGDNPFEVSVDELKKYLLINHNVGESYGGDENTMEGNVIASPFEKMEIYWPLDILKDGVEIIDSPGIDDPTCHGLIAKEYLPNAHAIIYVMSGLAPYNKLDVSELENLRQRHFTTPIFVVTRYDNVCEDADDDPQTLKEYKAKVFSDLRKHTDLVDEKYVKMLNGNGVFYVSSKHAKMAKRVNPVDREMLVKSGYAQFEKYLSDYLVKCKGEEFIKSVVDTMNSIGANCSQIMQEQLNAADVPLAEFEERSQAVQEKMEQAYKLSELFIKQFYLELDKLVTDADEIITQFIAGARSNLQSWIDSYHCSVENAILHPKRTAEAIVTEYSAHISTCYENYAIEWADTTLKPHLEEGLKNIAKRLEERTKAIDTTLQNIRVTLNLSGAPDGEMTRYSAAATIVGLLSGGGLVAAVAGNAIGFEGVLKGILTQIAVALALDIVVGIAFLPAAILTQVISFFIMGMSVKSSIVKKIGKKFYEQYNEALTNPESVQQIKAQITASLNEQLEELKSAANEAAYADIRVIESEVEQLRSDKAKGEEAVAKRKEELMGGMNEIQAILADLTTIQNLSEA